MEIAMFGAGCFWGVEAAFRKVEGVAATAVGYAGGTTSEPTYEAICTGTTGHAEVVQVEFDPARVTYDALLAAFWGCHDATQVNRQGPDIGTQYRSVIYVADEAQELAAKASRAAHAARVSAPIATAIEAAPTFWRAEEYHQQYLAKRGQDACATTLRK